MSEREDEKLATEGAGNMRADARRNREQIIAAARDVFVEQGVDAPLDEIARRAGVGIATLYRRFPDRNALVREVMLDNMARAMTALDRALEEHPAAWDALVAFMHDAVSERVTLLVPALESNIREEHRNQSEVWARRQEVFERAGELVLAAQREGRLRDDIGVGDIGIWLVKVCRPVPMLSAEVNDLAARRQLEVLIDGLRATPTDHGPELSGTPLSDELTTSLEDRTNAPR